MNPASAVTAKHALCLLDISRPTSLRRFGSQCGLGDFGWAGFAY